MHSIVQGIVLGQHRESQNKLGPTNTGGDNRDYMFHGDFRARGEKLGKQRD